MAGFLRFEPHEYQALVRAAFGLSHVESATAFRRHLTAALQADAQELAQRISALKAELILLLRNHIRVGAKQRQKVSSPKQSVTWQEWHVLARSWKSIGGPDVSSSESWERYIQEVELEMPVLADKLVRLDFGYKATLYRRLRSDKRWCP